MSASCTNFYKGVHYLVDTLYKEGRISDFMKFKVDLNYTLYPWDQGIIQIEYCQLDAYVSTFIRDILCYLDPWSY